MHFHVHRAVGTGAQRSRGPSARAPAEGTVGNGPALIPALVPEAAHGGRAFPRPSLAAGKLRKTNFSELPV